MDESLSEHIKLAASKGISKEDLRSLLLKAGWPSKHVEGYIQKTFREIKAGMLLKVNSIGKSFDDNVVLDQVDFDVKRGEIFGLIGVSGAGKTTLMNLLVGFLRPNKGDVLLSLPDGSSQSIVQNPDLIKLHFGFSTQIPSFYSKLTVRENLDHFSRLYHLSESERKQRISALLELVGLSSSKDVVASNLSGGMQKRLDIACALLHDPEVLILDEPTADLDPILRKQMWDLIRKINAKGTTIILASHFLAEIELLCTRIAILQNKRIMELGTADELRDIYSKKYEVFVETKSRNYSSLSEELKRKTFASISIEDSELVVQTQYPEKALSVIASRVGKGDLQSVHVARPTLGRVFEAVVKR